MLDKGTKPGAHLLSGAVVNPISLRSLFAGRRSTDMPFFGRVEKESVYFLTKRRAWRIPAPPTMRNHGNYVASLSQVGRWLAEEAEALGVTVLPETSADRLLVSTAASSVCAPATEDAAATASRWRASSRARTSARR